GLDALPTMMGQADAAAGQNIIGTGISFRKCRRSNFAACDQGDVRDRREHVADICVHSEPAELIDAGIFEVRPGIADPEGPGYFARRQPARTREDRVCFKLPVEDAITIAEDIFVVLFNVTILQQPWKNLRATVDDAGIELVTVVVIDLKYIF